MRYGLRRASLALVCVALTGLSAPPARAANADAPAAGVHGRIQARQGDGAHLRAVAGARVEFKRPGGNSVAPVPADANGYYKADLFAGTYEYTVEAPGLRAENVGRRLQFTLSQGYAVFDITLDKDDGSPPPKPAGNP